VTVGDSTFRDWLSDADRGAAKLRHACEAVGALARYEAGAIGQDDFPGHNVQVKVGIQKGTRNFPGDRNVIEDDRAADSASSICAPGNRKGHSVGCYTSPPHDL
jgi:hypothetical protein